MRLVRRPEISGNPFGIGTSRRPLLIHSSDHHLRLHNARQGYRNKPKHDWSTRPRKPDQRAKAKIQSWVPELQAEEAQGELICSYTVIVQLRVGFPS